MLSRRCLSSSDARGGAQPELGWNLLGSHSREEFPREEFVRAWRPVVFAERIGAAIPLDGTFNGYPFAYRTYTLADSGRRDQTVDRSWEVQLRFNEDGVVKITSRKPPRLDAQRDIDVMLATVTATSSKTLSSPVNGSIALAEVSNGTRFRLLCNIDVGPHGWWARTPEGFIAQADLDTGQGSLPQLRLCDEHYAEEALS